MAEWSVKKFVDFGNFEHGDYKEGVPWYGFHDRLGAHYVCSYFRHYIGLLDRGRAVWTAGETDPGLADTHYTIKFDTPKYVCRPHHRNALLVSEKKYVYELNLDTMRFSVRIDCEKSPVADSGCCVCDRDDDIWVNDVQGSGVYRFSPDGKLKEKVGRAEPGFNAGTVSFADAAFNWIYDLRLGPDGNLYVLDSKNYSVRMIDIRARTVTTICGDGTPGDSPPECGLSEARFGARAGKYFDGPWSLFVAEAGDIFVGDTWNGTVRAIDRKAGTVTTIAPRNGAAACARICGMDYRSEERRVGKEC